jgi:hypothetical protein
MTITNMQTTARIAAVIAGFALVLTSFAPVVGAQTTTATSSTSASVTAPFVRDLTIGSSGADVTALQAWLISRGFSIPAGPTGYFGNQTRAAVAAFQAANGIAPVAGYFGPVTRAKVNVMLGSGGGTTNPGNGGNTGNELRGGEADLRNFEFDREETSGNEGEEEVEVATARFDVEDGDVRIERLELYASATNSSLSQQPWKYFDRVIILADGKEIADKDVDNRSDWSRSGNSYRLNLTGLKHIVREGDEAEITIAFDVADSIDSSDLAQEFTFNIPDRGIRGTDAEGIQHYIGEDSDTVTFGFDEEESGDLRIRRNSDNPDPMTLIADEDRESDEYTVFAFDIENNDDVDTLINDLTVNVASSLDADDVIRRATLVVGGDEFSGDFGTNTITFDDMDLEIDGDDTESFELVIRLVRNAPDATLRFSLDGSSIEAEGVKSGDDADVGGSASSETHTVALTGIEVSGDSTSASVNNNGTVGTFRISFDVTALENDVYIYRDAAVGDNDDTPFSEVASTTGVVYTVYKGGVATTSDLGESSLIQSGARVEGDYFVVRQGDTKSFTLTVSLDPATATADLYYVELDAIRFDGEMNGTADDALYLVPNTNKFETNATTIIGA